MKCLTLAGTLGLIAVVLVLSHCFPYVGLLERDQPHAQGHDDLVVRVESSPGMGTLQSFFSRPPELVVTGDGTAYAPGGASRTGLVAPVVTLHLDEGGVQRLLRRADHDGLLADHPPYPSPSGVMDGGQTDVVLATSNGTWTHSGYALGSGLGFSARARLPDFVGASRSAVAHADAKPYRPTALRLLVSRSGIEPAQESTPPSWPAGTDVDLGRLGGCSVVTSPAAIQILERAPGPLFEEHGRTYAIAAAVSLPGDICPDPGS